MLNDFLSQYMTASRVQYISNHVLLRLIEHWKKAIDENFVAGRVTMDFSKGFHSVTHDLLIAKLQAYGFSKKKQRRSYTPI